MEQFELISKPLDMSYVDMDGQHSWHLDSIQDRPIVHFAHVKHPEQLKM